MSHSRHLVFAEAGSVGRFAPLDQIRPPFLLRNGAWTVAERWIKLLQPTHVTAALRPWIADTVRGSRRWVVNEPISQPPEEVWIICGAPSPNGDVRTWGSDCCPPFAWVAGGDAVVVLDRNGWREHSARLNEWIASGGQDACPVTPDQPDAESDRPIVGAAGLWDFVNRIADQLVFDWSLSWSVAGARYARKQEVHPAAVLIEKDRISTALGVTIGPHVVIDASKGPVILDTAAVVEPFTRLEGPAYVGPFTRLVGGKMSGGCAFGPGCKLGGEIEASIVQSFSNKVHEGFFGHGFIGSWVNLGALTTNSDLKNTYGTVRVVRNGETVDTGAVKVGSYLSDHTKTGIGTLLPTGSSYGVGCNIVTSGIATKHLPPFIWNARDEYQENDLERMMAVARIVVSRRHSERTALGMPGDMTGAEQTALRELHARTRAEREAFLASTR
ncbi:MAG: hypothetical protein Kow0074_14640 [Candidatus Zixiibacteriota bacterium]